MSQRNRSGRGSARNTGGQSHGEEVQIWDSCKSQLSEIITGINAENDALAKLVEMDKKAGAMDADEVPNDSLKQMDDLCRTGLKYSDANVASLRSVVEQLKILRAVVVAKEQNDAASAGPGKRAARDTAASSLYDFDTAGDSPVPSPIGNTTRKQSERNKDRDSMPPKAESVEPQAQGSSATKTKTVFAKGDAVAFKPKPSAGDGQPDWIMGEVAQVLGDSKNRRYKVLDIEPEDQSKQKEYRLQPIQMIAITPEDKAASLPDWEPGQVVLALYPQTTTFYQAEVDSSTADGKVKLKFDGENDAMMLQQVERRFVIEFRP